MSKHLALTMTRGDRPQLLEHCKWQVSRFAAKPDEHLIVDYAPKDGRPDLTERVKFGYGYAKENGFEWVHILEDDDFYKEDFLLRQWHHFDKSDFIGSEFTYYYNLRNRTWERTHHPNHSSLFCTAFRVEAMKDFKWNAANKVFLDLDLWQFARKKGFRRTFIELPAIGIKHEIGMTGGKGHKATFPNRDPDLQWLKSKVDQKSFEFYSNLKLV
jgi:hypothetical protein